MERENAKHSETAGRRLASRPASLRGDLRNRLVTAARAEQSDAAMGCHDELPPASTELTHTLIAGDDAVHGLGAADRASDELLVIHYADDLAYQPVLCISDSLAFAELVSTEVRPCASPVYISVFYCMLRTRLRSSVFGRPAREL